MNFDLKAIEPLVGSLIKAGAPTIAGLLTLAATPAVGPMVAGWLGTGANALLPQIAAALGAPEDTPPDQLQQMVDSDPTEAGSRLQALEAEHSYSLQQSKQDQDFAIATGKQDQDFKIQAQGQQAAINTVESSSSSKFQSWWRPAMGWGFGGIVMAGFALPYPVWLLQNIGIHLSPPPTVDQQAVYMLGALLGVLTVARSVEKSTGVATGDIKATTTVQGAPGKVATAAGKMK